MALIKPLQHDYAGDTCEPEAPDIEEHLNVIAITIRRSTARIEKAKLVLRNCNAALLTDRQTIERIRQLLARSA